MTVLILDSRVIYDLALRREVTQQVAEDIIDNLTETYELRVSCLVESTLNQFSSKIGNERINQIIDSFSDFFFDIDDQLLEIFQKISIQCTYSALEAAYAQLRGDAFIATTYPESFKGSGVTVCDNLELQLNKDKLEKLFLIRYKRTGHPNNIDNDDSEPIRDNSDDTYEFSNNVSVFLRDLKKTSVIAWYLEIFNADREIVKQKLSLEPREILLNDAKQYRGTSFQLSPIILKKSCSKIPLIMTNTIQPLDLQMLLEESRNSIHNNILQSMGLRAQSP